MGICLSCIGCNIDRDYPDEDEQSRLLFDEPLVSHYGSFGDYDPTSIYADPAEAQRAHEVLLKVVSKTSEHLVDIFAVIPQTSNLSETKTAAITTAAQHLTQTSRPQYYENIISKVPAYTYSNISHEDSSSHSSPLFAGWTLSDKNLVKVENTLPIHAEGVRPFFGAFTDPASAME